MAHGSISTWLRPPDVSKILGGSQNESEAAVIGTDEI